MRRSGFFFFFSFFFCDDIEGQRGRSLSRTYAPHVEESGFVEDSVCEGWK